MANRTAPIISQMFSFGVHRSIVATNPVSLLFKPGGKEHSSDRALSESECHAFLHGADVVCVAAVRYHTLMVLWLTLIRRGSLAKAEWIEFNFERKEWRVPAAHDKEKREHVVPLTDWAIQHLLALKTLSKGSRYVLPKQRKGKGERPCNAQIISRSVLRLRERFQVIGIAPFTPHDIRRTGRTFLAMLNVDERIAERVLNHSMGAIVETYDLWEYVPQKRMALEKLGSYYASLLTREAPSPAARDLIRLWKSGRRKSSRARTLRFGGRPRSAAAMFWEILNRHLAVVREHSPKHLAYRSRTLAVGGQSWALSREITSRVIPSRRKNGGNGRFGLRVRSCVARQSPHTPHERAFQ